MLFPFALAFLPECHTRNCNGFRLILNMDFVIYQSMFERSKAHTKFCNETNGTWNMVNQRQVWHNSHLALMYWGVEKKRNIFFYRKTFLFRTSFFVCSSMHLFLSSSDQRPNWWIHHVHTKKKERKKIFKSRFSQIFFFLSAWSKTTSETKKQNKMK